MFTVFILLLFLPTNWVLAAEFPPFGYHGNASLPMPPTGEGGNQDVVTHLLLQITQDMREIKQDVSQVKVDVSQVQLNQAVLQQDVIILQQDMTSIKLVSAVGQIKLESKYKTAITLFYIFHTFIT